MNNALFMKDTFLQKNQVEEGFPVSVYLEHVDTLLNYDLLGYIDKILNSINHG